MQLNSIFWRDADITEGTKASGYTIDDSFFPDNVINDFTGCDNGFFGLFIKLTLGTVTSYCDDFFEC